MPIQGSAPNKALVRTYAGYTGSDACAQADAGAVRVTSVDMDAALEELKTAINSCIFSDGGNFSASVDIQGQRFTNVADATARTHFAAAGQIADGDLQYAGTSSGTDTITASLSPAITAYVTGMKVAILAGGTNTGAATINLNSVGAKSIKKYKAGGTALVAGDITTGGIYALYYDGTNFQLLNPGGAPEGFTTADSPTFAAPTVTTLKIGGTTDTTLSRASAGVVAVEGVNLLRANQNLADVSSAATAFSNIKQAASTAASGAIAIADQAAMEAASSTVLAVVPGRQHNHPGHPKTWANFHMSGTAALDASYGVSSLVDNGTGNPAINHSTAFSSANYAWGGGAEGTLSAIAAIITRLTGDTAISTTTWTGRTYRPDSGTSLDVDDGNIVFHGDQ